MGKENDPQAKTRDSISKQSACPLLLPIKITQQTNATGGGTLPDKMK